MLDGAGYAIKLGEKKKAIECLRKKSLGSHESTNKSATTSAAITTSLLQITVIALAGYGMV